MFPAPTEKEEDGVKSLTESYHKYKREYVKHLSFNPEEENLSKCLSDCSTMNNIHLHLFPASVLEHAPLDAVYIYFDTATYDEIGRDEKVLKFLFVPGKHGLQCMGPDSQTLLRHN